ncbi:MAG: hypothetical protein JXA83_06995 [Acidimicrobiales bacterium]|nr:hypothetical protein [Acidimicrobiales bacterium]
MAATGERPATDTLDFLGGFVAAEGTLVHTGRRFAFRVSLAACDLASCELLRTWLGVGTITHAPRRAEHYDDEVTYAVQAIPDLVEVVVPFLDEHLPPSYKREQYVAWRADLMAYWDDRARRRRPCTVAGCDEPRRARGLCRRHYYAAYGR